MSGNSVGYAFIDNTGVLHIVGSKDDAERNSGTGRVLETALARKQGYPSVDGVQIVVYGENECYVDGNRSFGKMLNTKTAFRELAELYRAISFGAVCEQRDE